MPFFLNDRFLNDDEALLHVSDLSIQRGYAVFDFFRTVNGVPFFLNEYIDRFYGSAAAMHLEPGKSKQELSEIVYELIKRSSFPEAGIKLMVTGGYSPDGYHTSIPNLLIACTPLKLADRSDFEKGLSVLTHEYQRDLPQVKSINYLMAVWLHPLLKEKQADEILYFKNNIITEFPRANVFIVTDDKKLVTPAHNILLGITRKNILSLAKEVMETEERDVTVEEMLNASEIFLTSTTKRILPVIKINEKIIGDGKPGAITSMLYQKFLDLEKFMVMDGVGLRSFAGS